MNHRRSLNLLLVGFFVLVGCASSDFEKADADLLNKAEAGDADAQYELGLKYDKGEGVEQDYAEAVKWFRKSATQGNAMGQYNLGVMYAFGEGPVTGLPLGI